MRIIKNIIKGAIPPDPNVYKAYQDNLWLDIIDPTSPILKTYVEGEWLPLTSVQKEIDTVNIKVDEGTGTPSAEASVDDGVLTLNFHNLKGEKGEQGNTGSSVDYPFELVNNLTTNDATKALSAAQGVVLDGKVSQLGQEVTPIEITLTNNQYIDTSGAVGQAVSLTPISNNAYANAVIDVVPNDILLFTASGNRGLPLWAFIDDQDILLEKGIEKPVTSTFAVVPENAVKVVINNLKALAPNYEILLFKSNSVAQFRLITQQKFDKYDSAFTIGQGILNPNDADNVAGKYINPSSGSLADGNYFTTGYMPVIGGHTYYAFLLSGSPASIRNLAYFTSEKSIIYGAGLSNVTNFTPPSGAAYVRVSFSNSYGNFNNVAVSDLNQPLPYGTFILLNNGNVPCDNSPASKKYVDNAIGSPGATDILYGKKLCACGDSFTHGDYTDEPDLSAHKFQDGDYSGMNKVWPYYIGRRTKMNVVNLAQNGGTITLVDALVASNPRNCFSYQLYQDIPADADYIIIKYGINDASQLSQGAITIGTVTDSDEHTFYGAWNKVLSWIVTNRSAAKVGIIITNGTNSSAITEAIAAVAKKYGIPTLNEANGDNMPYFYRQPQMVDVLSTIRNQRDSQYQMNANNGHPNDACQEYESTIIEAFIRSL